MTIIRPWVKGRSELRFQVGEVVAVVMRRETVGLLEDQQGLAAIDEGPAPAPGCRRVVTVVTSEWSYAPASVPTDAWGRRYTAVVRLARPEESRHQEPITEGSETVRYSTGSRRSTDRYTSARCFACAAWYPKERQGQQLCEVCFRCNSTGTVRASEPDNGDER